jgi:hypothetical protein
MKFNIGDLLVPAEIDEEFSSIAYIADYKKLEELYQLTWIYKDGRTAQILYDYIMLEDVITSGYKLIPVKE